MTDEEVCDAAIADMRKAIIRMADAVPPPSLMKTASGKPHYRYVEKHPQQALVLKCVRTLSALHALRILVRAGLSLDAGAIMRILDELGSDIMFLAGPIIFRSESEPRHARYLKEFFQEEFDDPNPLKSAQKRDRVSRQDIRAYVARTYSGGKLAVSHVTAVTETIENAFSGYVHGAAVHTIDVYDGKRYCIPLARGDDPIESMRKLLGSYVCRALMSFEVTAKALGDADLWQRMRDVGKHFFDDYGQIRPQALT